MRSAPWFRLHIEADSFVLDQPGQVDLQELSIYLNGLCIGMMIGTARNAVEAEFPVPVRGRGGNECLLTLIATYATSPSQTSNSAADLCRPGWCFGGITLRLAGAICVRARSP